jgi:prepilin-type N-terminal cleavage/methylation domain-containing protein
MQCHAQRRLRGGFTLMEMMLSITIMLLVFGMAVPFFRAQMQALSSHAGRFDAQQNARFGANTVDRELRIAGAGLPNQQPMIVQATPYAVTFNADLATHDSTALGTFGAVYYNPDLPLSATTSMTPSTSVTLPLSSVVYPGTTYYNQAGPQSFAETISFWVAADTTAGSNGRYALYRRVNALPTTIVARGLVMRAGDPPPFTYMIVSGSRKRSRRGCCRSFIRRRTEARPTPRSLL